MAKQHRRDHAHHTERRRAKRAHRHPHGEGGGGGQEPGGPLMMSENRTLMVVIAGILVVGLIVFGVVWALAWS